jgi:hypothetical protein
VTVNVDPAMVIVPVRLPLLSVLAAAVNLTVPVPSPLAPLVIVIQLALLAAVHLQPGSVVTVTGPPVPPSFEKVWLVGEMVNVHAELWEIVTACPATVMVPLRAAAVFGSTA